MKKLHIAIAGMLLSIATVSGAQSTAPGDGPNASGRAPVNAGAIIMPAENDAEAARKRQENFEPGAAGKPGRQVRQKIPEHKKSQKTNCKGRADLCKQDSAR